MKQATIKYMGILIGLAIAAFGVVAFVLNGGILIGSATGIGRIVQHFYAIPVSYTVLAVNGLLFLLGFICLGKRFAADTIVCSIAYPLFINIFERMEFLKVLATDPIVSAIFGGVIIGTGLGIVIKCGASTGGTDIVAIILNKKFGIPLSLPMYALDVAILLSQVFFAESSEQVLLGIMLTFLYSMVASKVVIGGNDAVQLIVISKKYDEIRTKLVELVVGVTMIRGESGYLEKYQDLVFCVISNRELNKVKEVILNIDPEAFMTVSGVNEVRGRGFSFDRGLAKTIRNEKFNN